MAKGQAKLFVVVRFIARRVIQDYPIYLLNLIGGAMSIANSLCE